MKFNIRVKYPEIESEVDIEPGDRVRLRWYGDANVPIRLGYTWATVKSITSKNNLVIVADEDAYGTRNISPDRHVCGVIKVEFETVG